jgi:adenylate cyclase
LTTRVSIPLDEIDDCFQGIIPSTVGSVSPDGVPNVTYVSIVHHLDEDHVGLSRQFFNKTIANMTANPRLQAKVIEPTSGRMFILDLHYERTETEGPVFDRVRTRLDAVASQEGMARIFKLAAVDICRVLACRKVPSDWDQAAPRRVHANLDALDDFSLRLGQANDVEGTIGVALRAFAEIFRWEHSFLLLVDESGRRLYTVGSHGYEASGVGAEVNFGEGIIGVAAERRVAIRIGSMSSDVAYVQAVRTSIERSGGSDEFENRIPLPGLPDTQSQIAVPVMGLDRLLGVLCLQSTQPGAFRPSDEAALNIAARQLALALLLLRFSRDHEPMITAIPQQQPPVQSDAATQVKYYASDDSIFVNNEYVIKGIAGKVLWRLLCSYAEERRVDFTNKEIRLDPLLELPDIKDNLEARLILLRKRLAERCDFLSIHNTGRGRFQLEVRRQFELRQFA